ncbi:hypothetical protein BD289DRAFT_377579 [Coniella lustricola]|uniref:Major royal jelly protein n=1 Tax=Coniella lustricola TaxID=2025994 RepID=A0A2T2ZV87_9PEZI|nr:hypothetical protein BD289DRAFT_377579 [Coniella lustricola]
MHVHYFLLIGFSWLSSCDAAIDPRVQLALTLNSSTKGISTIPDGRIFMVHGSSPQITEYNTSTGIQTIYPYTKLEYDASSPNSSDIKSTYVSLNAQRIGPDGNLWLIDTGGSPASMPWGPKIIVINITTNSVDRIYHMGNVTKTGSLLDDIRFGRPGSNRAYLTDAGIGALITLDLATGQAVRLLEGHESVEASFPASFQGTLNRNMDGTVASAPAADDLEVTPDADYLLYQAASGNLWRIATKYLDQSLYNSSLATLLGDLTEDWAFTSSTGGTAIDADGTSYYSNFDRTSIDAVWANGTRFQYVQDDRLVFVDAMWVSTDQKLWMPMTMETSNGTYAVYTMDIGVGPSPIDHA